MRELANRALAACATISGFTEDPGRITRTFLSSPIRECYEFLRSWLEPVGAETWLDAVGNFRARLPGTDADSQPVMIGSHLDSVKNAGAFDGVLGVVLGACLAESTAGRLTYPLEIVGFSEEEGVRFDFPFIGSKALVGDLDPSAMNQRDELGVTLRQAILDFGLDPAQLEAARWTQAPRAFLEFHIEQGPVLDEAEIGLGVVEAIVGQSRLSVVFDGVANHAGTTPMYSRKDAFAALAEFACFVEEHARDVPGMAATIGKVEAMPGAANVVPGRAIASLDLRHRDDQVRAESVCALERAAEAIASKRGVTVKIAALYSQDTVAMSPGLTQMLERAALDIGTAPLRMTSGAGHDAMIIAPYCPTGMLFLRSPGGLSHHPEETVLLEDVEAALKVGQRLLLNLNES